MQARSSKVLVQRLPALPTSWVRVEQGDYAAVSTGDLSQLRQQLCILGVERASQDEDLSTCTAMAVTVLWAPTLSSSVSTGPLQG